MINLEKKGIIILSHYRSGSTQYRRIMYKCLVKFNLLDMNITDVGEVDFHLDIPKLKTIEETFFKFEEGEFKIIQLNNPLVISYLLSTDIFNDIVKDFEIITVIRKSKKNCLLSLPLWERFILSGLNESNELWTKENMEKFHNDTLKDPIWYSTIYNGLYHENLPSDSPSEYLDKKIIFFLNSVSTLRHISKKFKAPIIYYEDFEFDKNYIYESHFKDLFYPLDCNGVIGTSYKWKIPYISKDYLVYFDEHVKQSFEEWQID